MAGITVTQDQLAALIGTPITTARYDAVDASTLRLIRSGYRLDLTVAEGRIADVLDAVYTSVAVRLLTNPTGVRTMGLGSAQATFGGTDDDISSPGALTAQERADLAALNPKRRPTYVRFRTVAEAAPLGPDGAYPEVV